MNADAYDVVIVGGGMVGASFALALRATRLRVERSPVVSSSCGAPVRVTRASPTFFTTPLLLNSS